MRNFRDYLRGSKVYLIPISCLMFASLSIAAEAVVEIVLEYGAIGEDAQAVREFIAAEFEVTEENMEEFHVGRVDLNKDGAEELIVVFSTYDYCGTAGCMTSIFENVDGSLNEVASLYVYGPYPGRRDNISLHAKDEGAPYLTVYGYHLGVRWDGTSYRWFCIGRECERPEWRN